MKPCRARWATISRMSSSACCAGGRVRWSHECARGTAASGPRLGPRHQRGGRQRGQLDVHDRAADTGHVVGVDHASVRTRARAPGRRDDGDDGHACRRRDLSRRRHHAEPDCLSQPHVLRRRPGEPGGTEHPPDLLVSGNGRRRGAGTAGYMDSGGLDSVSNVSLLPAFQATYPASGDATKLGPNAWKAARLFTGGTEGQILTRASASATGATWGDPANTFSDHIAIGTNPATTGAIRLADTGTIVWGSANDLILQRDAADILALKNGANAQALALKIYGTATKTLTLSSDAGYGRIIASAGNFLSFGADGALDTWQISPSSYGYALLPGSDNTLDIGNSSSPLRIRSAYLGTSLSIGTNPATTGAIRLANNTAIAWSNSGNTINYTLTLNAFNQLVFNGAAFVANATNSIDLGTGSIRWRNLFVSSSVVNKVKAGTPTDADVVVPTDGMLVLDSTANKIWVRLGGAWKGVAVT